MKPSSSFPDLRIAISTDEREREREKMEWSKVEMQRLHVGRKIVLSRALLLEKSFPSLVLPPPEHRYKLLKRHYRGSSWYDNED